MKKILVTGGNGFIGDHVVDNLLKKGYKVTIFDRRKTKQRDDVEYFYGDVRDWESISEAIYKSDGVIHLAGVLGTQETVRNPRPAIQTNILGSINVFEACALYNKKAVYISVGNYWMNNPYSISKSTAERFALMYNKDRGTKIAVVRGLNAYGPGQKAMPIRKIIPNFIIPALKNEDITIYGSGKQQMDMIYVDDIAETLVKALMMEHNVYDFVFEAGTGVALPVNDIANMVVKACNSKSKINHVDMRPGEESISVVRADIKTLEPLGLDEFTPFDEGIKKTVEWYRDEA